MGGEGETRSFSVVTYDKNDKMLNTGNGFFVSEDGLALSDYSLFKGAERAVVITADGKQMPVDVILGLMICTMLLSSV